jgi:putative Holliday junction resolvase
MSFCALQYKPIMGTDNITPAARGAASEAAVVTGEALVYRALLGEGLRLIGIDLGTKTLGLALSDVTRMVASPLDTLVRGKFTIDANRLNKLAAEYGVGGFVIGLPVNLDGTEGPRAQSTRAFARNLSRLLPLPILLWDERLTTQAAERMLIDADQSRKRRSEVIDKLAATLILQGALDRMRG